MPIPTQKDIEDLCLRKLALEKKIEELNKEWNDALLPKTTDLLKVEAELLKMVEAHGSVHAEKSKLLRGTNFEAMVTYGTYTSIDNAAVERFRMYLEKTKSAKLLRLIFVKSIRWALHPNSAALVQGEKLTVGQQALYSQCEISKPKKPRLEIRQQHKTVAA
jgi:hypothetical protein